MHAKIENGSVVEYPIVNLAQRLPNVSLPADLTKDSALPDGYVYVNPAVPPQYNSATQTLEQGTPVKTGGKWFIGYAVRSLTSAEKSDLDSAYANTVRQDRNARLSECDWTQVADAPVDKAAWASYRQALRDVTSQPGFPHSVAWPSAPL